LGAAFDTQLQMRFSGSAAKGIEGKLKGLGFRLVAVPLMALVEGDSRRNEWHLLDGELEKTRRWAEEVGEALIKQRT
jgi:hypothetical protein